jgi:hypothetical protein
MPEILHCRQCAGSMRCGNSHLYVVELDYSLTNNKRFMHPNRQHIPDMDCLYVGSTSHTPACRFLQHQLHAKKRELGYTCQCDGKDVFREFVRGGGKTRGSYYPGVYGLRLRPDLYAPYNPIHNEKYASLMEQKLALILRKKGYAVWQH